MGRDCFALDGRDFGLGFKVLPLGGVLPGFEGGRDAESGKGIAEVSPFPAIGLGVDDRVAFGRW